MKLNRLRATGTAGILAVALLVSGCGRDQAETVATTQASSEQAAQTTEEQDTGMTSEEMTSEEMTSEEMTSEEMTSEDMTSDEADDSGSATSATTTVGDSSGDLDDTTITWFDTLCTGLAPVAQLGSADPTASASDPQALKTLGDSITAAGASLTQTSTDLGGLEPPTFDGGSDFAAKMVPGLAELGTTFATIGGKIAGGDFSGLEELATSMQSGPLADLAAIDATPETKAAVAEIPSCKALGMS